jgi:transcription antitermination factor NusG
MTQWFAVFCQSQREQLASRSLRERGFEVWWPYTTEWVAAGHKANSRLVRRPWLNRYLFAKSDKEDLWRVNDAMGVGTVVYAPGGEPFPVPDKIMETLFCQADHLGCIYESRQTRRVKRYSSGQVIRLLDEKSPLFGLYIEVQKVLDNGSILGMLREQIAGTGKVFLQEPVIGEVVEGAA